MVKLIEGQKYFIAHNLKENDLVTRLAIMPKVSLTNLCMYVCMYVWLADWGYYAVCIRRKSTPSCAR